MKVSPTTSRYASVCLSLFFSYALLISNIAAFTPKAVHAAPATRPLPLRSQTANPSYSTNTNAFAQGANSSPSREGEVLVRFRTVATEHDKNVIALTHNAERKKLKGDSGIEKLRSGAGQSAQSLVLALLQQPAVEFAEPNFLIETNQSEAVGPNDDEFAQQWALRNVGQNSGQYGSDIDAASAWQTTTGTAATVIAVIDSGVDFTHPDLANNKWNNSHPSSEGDLHGWDYVVDNGVIKDEQGHGTAIAGIIAAQGNNATGISGVMWRASLMSLRVLDNTGTGDIGDAVEAID